MSSVPKCIILDLDQTLLCSEEKMDVFYKLRLNELPQYRDILSRCYYFELEDLEGPGVGTIYSMWGIRRPHLNDFLTFCFEYFDLVIVWSAGKPPYVSQIVKQIFNNLMMPHIVLDSEDVDKIDGNPLKSIPKLIEIIDQRYPHYNDLVRLDNTLAVDDIVTNFYDNPYNGILIPEYIPELTYEGLARNDSCLLQIKNWLMRPDVDNAIDVRDLDKSQIFRTPA